MDTKWLSHRGPNRKTMQSFISTSEPFQLSISCRAKETRKIVEASVRVSHVVQPLTPSLTLFTIEINRAQEPRSKLLLGLGRYLYSTSHILQICMEDLHIDCRRQGLHPVLVHHPACSNCKRGKVNHGNGQPPFTEIRVPHVTHLISNTSRHKLENSHLSNVSEHKNYFSSKSAWTFLRGTCNKNVAIENLTRLVNKCTIQWQSNVEESCACQFKPECVENVGC